MVRRTKFWTGAITIGREYGQPAPPFKGSAWEVGFAAQRRRPPTVYGGREVVVFASDWSKAQLALDLIEGAHQLLLGDPPIVRSGLLAHNNREPAWMNPADRIAQAKTTWSSTNIPLACSIAAKISRRKRWTYALSKYNFSLSLFSVHHIDLEPWKAPYLALSPLAKDHIAFCHAIISAFSAIEDLKLTLQASRDNPSRINGQWNPKVKNDLEARLQRKGIDIRKPILWVVRGPRRRIENKREVPQGITAPWSATVVRDSDIPIIDAIAYAEWLRSGVASHALNEFTSAISPYDVINVQHVTRRLLLETLGFWR